MSEPLDPDTAARIARTRAAAAVPRKVDLPAVAADVRIGTLVHRARPVEAIKPPPPKVTERIAVVQAVCADVWGVPVEVMRKPGRGGRQWASPRQAAMALSYRLVVQNKERVADDFCHTAATVKFAITACVARISEPDVAYCVSFAEKYREAEARCRVALGVAA